MTPFRAMWLAGAACLGACAPTSRPTPVASTAPICRVGPDGGPVLAERGIGGTGAPVTQLAERGIGGTGIIGVVTGFASICLAGHEVALPADVPVEIGGIPADPQALRAGQVAAVEAGGPADALYAKRIMVRYEVQGPVEAVAPDRLQVAGQTVLLSPDTWLRTPPARGQWVAVSGLRDGTGAIAATRLDLVSTHTIVVHGAVQRSQNGYRLGDLPIVAGPGDVLVPGMPVSLTGIYDDGGVRAASIAPDLLAADPAAFFGGTIDTVYVEGFASPAGGRFSFGTLPSLQAPAGSRPIRAGRNVIEFHRVGSGGMRIDSVLPSVGGGEAGTRFQPAPVMRGEASRAFEPAPMPNRSLGFGPGQTGAGARAGDGAIRGQGFRPPGGSFGPGPGGGGGGGDSGPPGDGGGRRR